MAPRFARRRGNAEEPEDDPDATVDLGDEDHAWWAQREVQDVWSPRDHPAPAEDEPVRDVLAEHFGDDWRTSFGFDAAPPPSSPDPDPEPAAEEDAPPVDGDDPYAVLAVEESATWEEIVAAHRRMARRHHPDRLAGASEAQREAGEDRIRAINAAYAELKVRRGR